jgi:hypothetical protein
MPLSLRRILASAISLDSTVHVFAHHHFEQLLDLALLVGL